MLRLLAVAVGVTSPLYRRYSADVATLDDVRRYALDLRGTSEGVRHNNATWSVAGKVFAWDRSFSKADIRRFGTEEPPSGDIIAISTIDLADKEAILSAGSRGFFTIEHFDNYPAFLIQLDKVGKRALKEAVVDAWLTRAPVDLSDCYLE